MIPLSRRHSLPHDAVGHDRAHRRQRGRVLLAGCSRRGACSGRAPTASFRRFVRHDGSRRCSARGLCTSSATCCALWIFGDNVEDRLGHGRFLLFYLLAGRRRGPGASLGRARLRSMPAGRRRAAPSPASWARTSSCSRTRASSSWSCFVLLHRHRRGAGRRVCSPVVRHAAPRRRRPPWRRGIGGRRRVLGARRRVRGGHRRRVFWCSDGDAATKRLVGHG